MPPAIPLECPACGHDRITRRAQRLRTETGKLRVDVTEWTCPLCRYVWTRQSGPAMPLPRPD